MPRLKTRRGSVSASDPWSLHPDLNLNTTRESSSTLTILRVPSDSSHSTRPRLSFAFSSGPAFTSPGPSSPRSLSRASSIKPRLPPDQLVDLARQSVVPRSGHTTFTPLPPSVYLPFVDRPTEVEALISSPPTSKLFALLAQTLPHDDDDPKSDILPTDPTKWTFSHLSTWLTQIDRETASDSIWIQQTRKCIITRSEFIWERVKGALGVPPELDVDHHREDEYVYEDNNDVFESDSSMSNSDSITSWTGSSSFTRSPIAGPSDPSSASLTVLLATPSTVQPNPSNPPDTGLQDISEAAEDEEAAPEIVSETKASTPPPNVTTQPQIHGLRLSTSRVPVSSIHTPPRPSHRMFSSAVSSRSNSFSSVGGAPMRRFSFSSASFMI